MQHPKINRGNLMKCLDSMMTIRETLLKFANNHRGGILLLFWQNVYTNFVDPLNARCPLKGHTYLNNPAAKSCRFV